MSINEYSNMTAFEILNYYRNCHYADGSNTESGILANALNEILPEYTRLKIADSDIVCPDVKKCMFCANSKIGNIPDSFLICYHHPLNIGERTLVHPDHSCPNFLPEKN